jgi:hypothetical protein
MIAALLVSVACSDSAVPTTPTPSDPTLAAALSVTMTAAAVAQVAYVALDPGTIAGGTSATITDRVSGVERSASIVDGGFDPVAVPATSGDTLIVTVATTGGQVVIASVIARPHPPHVVRVDPPKDQTDVPLNTNLTVVFNEPVSAATLTPATIQLREGPVTVPGTISVNPDAPWLAIFTPSQALVPGSTYTFTVTGAIADPTGLQLDAPATISFTTGAVEGSVASITLSPLVAAFGGSIRLTAIAKNAAGNALAGRTYVWTSSDTTIASVDSTGLVTASQERSGVVTITASTGGQSGSATMTASCTGVLSPACVTSTFGPGTRTVNGIISQLMPDGSTHPMANTTYYGWISVPNGGGYTTGARQTDANGAFRIDNVQDGKVSIVASLGAVEQPCMAVASTMGGNAAINVTLVDPANPMPQRTTTAPAVTGTVYRIIDGVKTPLAGATVQYSAWVPDLLLAETVSDSSGRYALCNLQFSFGNSALGYIFATASENRFVYEDDKWATLTVAGPGTVDIIVP